MTEEEKREEKNEGVAVCLTCSNEWVVRDPAVKKKRKCPVCGKYRVKLKSEIAAAPVPAAVPEPGAVVVVEEKKEEIAAAPKREGMGTKNVPEKSKMLRVREKRKEKVAAPVIEKKEEKREEIKEEKKEEKSGGSLMWAAIAVFIVGAAIGVYFLWRPSRKKPDTPPKDEGAITVHPGVRRMMKGAAL